MYVLIAAEQITPRASRLRLQSHVKRMNANHFLSRVSPCHAENAEHFFPLFEDKEFLSSRLLLSGLQLFLRLVVSKMFLTKSSRICFWDGQLWTRPDGWTSLVFLSNDRCWFGGLLLTTVIFMQFSSMELLDITFQCSGRQATGTIACQDEWPSNLPQALSNVRASWSIHVPEGGIFAWTQGAKKTLINFLMADGLSL